MPKDTCPNCNNTEDILTLKESADHLAWCPCGCVWLVIDEPDMAVEPGGVVGFTHRKWMKFMNDHYRELDLLDFSIAK